MYAPTQARQRRKEHVLAMARWGVVTSHSIRHALGVCERTAERYLVELSAAGQLTLIRGSQPWRYQLTDAGRERIPA